MPWPTVAVNTTNIDANADSPLAARSDILDLTTKFNELIAMRGVANGVASLDAAAKVPVAQLYAGVANGVASLNANGKIPTGQILQYTGSYTSPTLNAGASTIHNITHGLGTDDLLVDVLGKGQVGVDPTRWGCEIAVGGTNFTQWVQGAAAWNPFIASLPATGVVRLLVVNLSGTLAQTITVAYAIRPRS